MRMKYIIYSEGILTCGRRSGGIVGPSIDLIIKRGKSYAISINVPHPHAFDPMKKFSFITCDRIAPMTSKSKDYITRVKFELDGTVNWIALDQIRTIVLTRIIKIIGELKIKEIRKVKSIIKETFVD